MITLQIFAPFNYWNIGLAQVLSGSFVVNGGIYTSLTYCDLVTAYGELHNWVIIGTGNDLLPDGTMLLSAPLPAHRQWGPTEFTWR